MVFNYEHRKAKNTFRFVNAAGVLCANQDINIKLVNHQFMFGCGAFDVLNATSDNIPTNLGNFNGSEMPAKEFFQDRTDKWLKVFNYGTIPFYWGGFEPTEGNVQTESRMNAAKYLQERGVRVKGHPLCWHTVCADWLMEYDNATILQKQLDRINREVTEFKGVVDVWDVINEVVIMPEFDKYDNAITRICKDLGRVKLVKEVFDAAKAANPNAVLLINDFNLSERYKELISDCLDAGVPISAIGLQTHQHQGYMGKEKLQEVLERFESFGIPMHFTENTLISGQIMPSHIVDLNDYQVDEWPSTPEGEERQRKEWREMYEILFAHPLVKAITGWDFADGAWLKAPSGIVRVDNSIKPVYNELKNMIHNEWSTEITVHTDENGYAEIEGFKGEYKAQINDMSGEFTLSDSDLEGSKKVVLN